jgi:hypothetical protein
MIASICEGLIPFERFEHANVRYAFGRTPAKNQTNFLLSKACEREKQQDYDRLDLHISERHTLLQKK